MPPPVPSKRIQQAMFEVASSMNRSYGSGGGSGLGGFINILLSVAAGNQGTYSTANAATFVDITNTSGTFQVARPCFFMYLVFASAHLSAAGSLGYIRGNIVTFDTTASLEFGPTNTTNGTMPYFPVTKGPIQPGTYTAKLQAATDANTFNISVDQFFHVILATAQ